MKLNETEKLKLQYVNNVQTTTSYINHIQDSDNELAEKITQILNIIEKNPYLKVKENFHSKNGVTIAAVTDIALLNADKNNNLNQMDH